MFLSNPLFLGLWGFSNRIPLDGVQILFGVYTGIENDKYISEMDNGQFRRVQVNSTASRSERCSLSLRIRQDNFLNFYSFVKTNFGKVVELEATNISPFISTNAIEEVYITRYTSPKKEKEKYYTMEVELRKV